MGSIREMVHRQRAVTQPRKVYTLLPGDALERFFNKWGIKQKAETCNCRKVQNRMNALGPEGCTRHLEKLVHDVRASIIEWKEGSRIIPTPPNLLIKLVIQKAIRESLRTLQTVPPATSQQ